MVRPYNEMLLCHPKARAAAIHKINVSEYHYAIEKIRHQTWYTVWFHYKKFWTKQSHSMGQRHYISHVEPSIEGLTLKSVQGKFCG